MNEDLKPGIYRHFKGGLYELIGVATDSETLTECVIYRQLYKSENDISKSGLWVRPLAMWNEEVTAPDATTTKRFTYLGDKND